MSSNIDHEIDVHEKILDRVNTFLVPATVQQIRDDLPNLSCAQALRILSLLPPVASSGFATVTPGTKIVFPRDHNMHYLQEQENYTLLFNGTTNSGRRVAITSTIQRRSITPPSPAMFSLEKNNELFHSCFSITIGKSDEKDGAHWYFEGDGGLMGMFKPGIHDGLPFVTIQKKGKTEGFLKGVRSNKEKVLGSHWKMTGESGKNKGSIDLNLRLSSATVKSMNRLNKMMYYFPKVSVTGQVSIPGAGSTNITGTATLIHEGFKNTKKQPSVNIFIQFPNNDMIVTATSLIKGSVLKGNTFQVKGSVQKGETKEQHFEAGEVVIKDVFKSPTTGVIYPIEMELSIGNKVVSLTPLFKDQRQFEPTCGETWIGGINASLISAVNTTKPQGVGFISVKHLISSKKLKSLQLKKLKIAPLEGNFSSVVKNSELTKGRKGKNREKLSWEHIGIITSCALVFLIILFGFFIKKRLA